VAGERRPAGQDGPHAEPPRRCHEPVQLHSIAHHELVLLAFAVALAQLPALAVEDGPGEGVPALGPVELSEDPSAVGLVVEVGEQVEGLGDPAEFGDGPPERGGPPAGPAATTSMTTGRSTSPKERRAAGRCARG